MKVRKVARGWVGATVTFAASGLLSASVAFAQADWGSLLDEAPPPPPKRPAVAAPAPAPASVAPKAAEPTYSKPRAEAPVPAAPPKQAVRPVPAVEKEVARPVPPPAPKAPRVVQEEAAPPPAETVHRAPPKPVEVEEVETAPVPAAKHRVAADELESETAPAAPAPRQPKIAEPKVVAPKVEEEEVVAPKVVAPKIVAPKVVEEEVAAPPVAAAPKAPAARPVAPGPAELLEEAAQEPVAPVRAKAAAPKAAAVKAEAPAAAATGTGTSLAAFGLREGDIITAENMSSYLKLISPGLDWGLRYGWKLTVVEPTHITLPSRYIQATERYSSQVRLSDDGLSLENYTAGLPFPSIDTNDPRAALKIMWNFYHNTAPTDDQVQRGVDTNSGSVQPNKQMTVERHLILDSYRKLYYNGRLYIDPKPTLPNPDGVRYKESLHPILEPFDLKGVGFTSYRYEDPSKQDDSWLYLPQLRRVRRMSSAQRSDALFGQDTDADAFAGYNGHIAWMDYRLLGEQTILATMHARHFPMQWQDPVDWLWDDVWEPREVYIVEARSKIPQYAYSKRVLFIDKEGWVIAFSDSYDRAGQLWKSQFLGWAVRNNPGEAGSAVEPALHQNGVTLLDEQLQHVTATGLPRSAGVANGGQNLNVGARLGVTEDFFTVAHLIAGGR